jgi:hypothetical protein
MVAEPLVVEFHEDSREAVVRRMSAMAGQQRGWVNFSPGLDVDAPPPQRPALASIFGNKGPEVPLATWTPGGGRRDPPTVGIHHAQGQRTLRQLSDKGIELPEGWRKLQDHPKRGLVCAVPATGDVDELDRQLHWLLTATAALCPVPLTGEWRALCYHAI